MGTLNESEQPNVLHPHGAAHSIRTSQRVDARLRSAPRYGASYLVDVESLPEIARTELVCRVIGSNKQWVSIDGVPGMGRTTLLSQIEDELKSRKQWVHAIWKTQQAYEVFAASPGKNTHDLRPLLRWLRSLAPDSPPLTLLIDDYDQHLNEDHRRLLHGLLLELPELRLITTSIDPVTPPAGVPSTHGHGVVQVERIAPHELLFTDTEVAQFAEALPSGVTLPTSAPSYHQIFATTRGVPLGVALSFDRLIHAHGPAERQLSQVMSLVHTDVLHTQLRRSRRSSMQEIHALFSLMPRFWSLHLSACIPNLTLDLIHDLALSPALDPRRRICAGEYAWSAEFLVAATQLNGVRASERRSLAMNMRRLDYLGAAFEQWFLAGDLSTAETLLRARFLTVYETLSPETADEILATPQAHFADYPMIRVMQTLLDERATPANLNLCLTNLKQLGNRGGHTGLIALAVRAAILARRGRASIAYSEAEQVLTLAATTTWVENEDTTEKLQSVAEAVLTAVLALLEIGTIPSTLAVLPRVDGETSLRERRDLAQRLLEQLRGETAAHPATSTRNLLHSYRALVCADLHCHAQIDAITAHDEYFRCALHQPDRVQVPAAHTAAHFATTTRLPLFHECLRLLTLGDHAAASRLAWHREACEPHASLLRSIVLLATGRAREARELLDALSDDTGPRTAATRTVLRACALHRLGLPEAARAALTPLRHLPESPIVQAFGFLRPEDARDLATLYPVCADFVRAAELTGVLGSGRQITEIKKFSPLTEKERTVLRGLRDGLNTRQIAEQQRLSVNTVRTHVRMVGKKLDAHGHAQMLRRAEELRIFADDPQ